jgi:uncharacterized protein
VVASARREDRLAELVTGIRARGGSATAIRCDVARRQDVQGLAGRVRAEFGGCDVLVNNAGIPGGGPFAGLTWEQIASVVETNYVGVLSCTQAFVPMMLDAGRGHVVSVASLAGRFAVPGSSVYSSTKHAVVAFSEALHYELSPRGVSVTSVNPGLVRTEAFPHRDRPWVMRPDRIASTIVRVLRTGRAPEVSVPRPFASLQAIRLLAPPLYRFGLRRVARSRVRDTAVRGSSDD